MPLVKAENGLLEHENFFLTTSITDFLGGGAWSRNTESFRIISDAVMRKLPYEMFTIDVKKEPVNLAVGSFFEFFISNGPERFGIREDKGDNAATNWRIVYYGGFIQTYASFDDGVTWDNKGGANITLGEDTLQGFFVYGSEELTVYDYKVYRSPYVTFQNSPYGALLEFITEDGALTRYFDENMECRVFLDRETNGVIRVAEHGDEIFTTSQIYFLPGDVFLYTTNDIRLIHKERILDYSTTYLYSYSEMFTVKNAGESELSDIYVSVINESNDSVLLSLDQTEYAETLYIDKLSKDEERELYVKIALSASKPHYKLGKFEISIH